MQRPSSIFPYHMPENSGSCLRRASTDRFIPQRSWSPSLQVRRDMAQITHSCGQNLGGSGPVAMNRYQNSSSLVRFHRNYARKWIPLDTIRCNIIQRLDKQVIRKITWRGIRSPINCPHRRCWFLPETIYAQLRDRRWQGQWAAVHL